MARIYNSFSEFDVEHKFSEKAGFTLKPLQVEDIEQFAKWPVALNTYEVGGGKTVISTAVSLMSGADFTLVIVPPILIRPWVRWLLKVSSRVIHYQGTKEDRATWIHLFKDARWVVMSHAIFRRDYSKIWEHVVRHGSYELIVDEAHSLKSVESKLFKYVNAMAKGHRLQLLTGTPTSKPLDAYAYIALKTPKAYRSFQHFKMAHVTKVNFFKQPEEYGDLDKVAELLAINNITRTKKEVHGYDNKPLFPDTSYRLAKDHYKLYERLVTERLLELDNGEKIDASTAQKLYFRVQQMVVNYDYFSADPTNRSAAYDLIDSVVDQTNCLVSGNSKLIIWTYYKMTTASVLAYFKKAGIKAVGAYSGANGQDSFDKFVDDDSTRILVAQPQSAGAGLNPQEVCSEALVLETSTVSLYNTQLCGRIDRVGQKRKPTIRFAVAEGTIQVALFDAFLKNDDLVSQVELSRKSFRDILLGSAL